MPKRPPERQEFNRPGGPVVRQAGFSTPQSGRDSSALFSQQAVTPFANLTFYFRQGSYLNPFTNQMQMLPGLGAYMYYLVQNARSIVWVTGKAPLGDLTNEDFASAVASGNYRNIPTTDEEARLGILINAPEFLDSGPVINNLLQEGEELYYAVRAYSEEEGFGNHSESLRGVLRPWLVPGVRVKVFQTTYYWDDDDGEDPDPGEGDDDDPTRPWKPQDPWTPTVPPDLNTARPVWAGKDEMPLEIVDINAPGEAGSTIASANVTDPLRYGVLHLLIRDPSNYVNEVVGRVSAGSNFGQGHAYSPMAYMADPVHSYPSLYTDDPSGEVGKEYVGTDDKVYVAEVRLTERHNSMVEYHIVANPPASNIRGSHTFDFDTTPDITCSIEITADRRVFLHYRGDEDVRSVLYAFSTGDRLEADMAGGLLADAFDAAFAAGQYENRRQGTIELLGVLDPTDTLTVAVRPFSILLEPDKAALVNQPIVHGPDWFSGSSSPAAEDLIELFTARWPTLDPMVLPFNLGPLVNYRVKTDGARLTCRARFTRTGEERIGTVNMGVSEFENIDFITSIAVPIIPSVELHRPVVAEIVIQPLRLIDPLYSNANPDYWDVAWRAIGDPRVISIQRDPSGTDTRYSRKAGAGVASFIDGTTYPNQTVLRFGQAEPFMLTGGVVSAEIPASALTTFAIYRNQGQVGTITFQPNASVGTVVFVSGANLQFQTNDVLSVRAITGDPLLENISITLTFDGVD
jgi:hypothetical protein